MSNDNLAISPTGELGDALSTNLHIINRTQELIGELNALIGKISGQKVSFEKLWIRKGSGLFLWTYSSVGRAVA